MSDKTKRMCTLAVLALVSGVISVLERPLMAAIPLPLPGFKLGLSNVCVLFCLYRMRPRDAVVVLALRIAITGLLFGSPTSFILSLSGGLCAITAAILTYRIKGLSPVGVSVASSAMHMTGQICCASIILKTGGLFVSYLPWLLVLSVPTGIINGVIASALINKLPSGLTKYNKNTTEGNAK